MFYKVEQIRLYITLKLKSSAVAELLIAKVESFPMRSTNSIMRISSF